MIGTCISRLQLPLVCLLFAACFLPTAPIFPPDVATALHKQPMRRMETDYLEIYYPEKRRADALRIAERLEGCATALKSQVKIHNSYADQKMTIVIPDMAFNNAFVAPSFLGSEAISVIPTSNTFDFVTELGIPSDPSYVGCHEIVHYVHLLQVSGFWGWLNRYLGDTMTPQIGLDAWFIEGLATYYESRLQPGTGRMAWPVWRGSFHAGFADKRINGGDLNASQRPFHFGNAYLVGSHFIEFLATRYGEEALWKIVDVQGDSILFPFGVALRFKSATGKSLPALIDEFADAVETHFPPRNKPPEQTKIRGAGSVARYAVSASGREALIVEGPDLTTTLRIYDSGKRFRERKLEELLPPRNLVIASPLLTTGMSFTADGKDLYFVAVDIGPVGQEARLLRYQVESDSLEVIVPNIKGTGGGVTTDGKTYYYGYTDGDRKHVAALDLTTGTSRIIRTAEGRNYFDLPRPSPDGRRLAVSLFNGERFVIALLGADSGRTEVEVPYGGTVHDPSWIDDNRLLFLGEHEGRFQVHVYKIKEGTVERISDAPYVAFQPRAHQGSVRFLDRVGWNWTLDQVSLPKLDDSAPEKKATDAIQPAALTTANRAVRVHSDAPYSQLDSILYPRFRAPLLLSAGDNASILGMQLTGGDPLGFHRWSVFGQYDLVGGHVSGGAHYVNAMLAPLEIRVELEHHKWNESLIVDDETVTGPLHSETRGIVALGRTIRSSRIDLLGIALEEEEPDDINPDFHERRLAGPGIQLQHSAVRSTAYAGPILGYALSGSATHYSDALSSLDVDLSDFGATLNLVGPLPLYARHTITLGLRGRRLYGPERNESFLVVGGSTLSAELWSRSNREDPPEVQLPSPEPLVTFQEPLRGFEDLEFSTDRIAIADFTYRLPIILDFGTASTAYLLPSLFFQELNLEAFAAAATDSFASFEDRRHLAAGGSIALDLVFSVFPLRLRYQLSRRFTDDEAFVQLFTLGVAI